MKSAARLICAGLAWIAAGQAQFSAHLLPPEEYSQQANEQIVKQFQDLRTTDIVDALDEAGIGDQTWMDARMHPLWRDEVKFTHRIYGVAVTLRLVPPQTRSPGCGALSAEECKQWRKRLEAMGYDSTYALPLRKPGQPMAGAAMLQYLRPDTVLVIDQSGTRSNGLCGSTDALNWLLKGVRGIVTNTGCRDTDETVLERIPIYQMEPTLGVNQGRMMIESYNAPVVVGGVLVMPGDIIAADGNGVVVVPRAYAAAVAASAHRTQEKDSVARRKLYDKAGRPPDFTIKEKP
jgi:4-hydroxy-4-methyl-2-oxoglutarate aldolase